MRQESSVQTNQLIFDSNVSSKLQKALLKSVCENYQKAANDCWANFHPSQAKDLSGHYRLAKIEDEWSGISALFPDVESNLQYYKYKSGSFNEITVGEIKLTQSCVSSKDDLPRRAVYRKTLAKSGQYNLFIDEQPSGENYLYAILIHGVDVLSKRRSRPAFARIEFPDGDCKRYLPGGIDL